jgi:anaerobic selenocysteine-containing dehydrogenase
VSGYPEVLGEFPIACLAEEIEQPGQGQVRAFILIAGNPVISAPNGPRLDAALATLEFTLAIDTYLSDTARRADVVLPGTSPFEKSHYDLFLSQVASRNFARYSPAMFALPDGQLSEWEIMLQLTAIVMGAGALNRNGLKTVEDMILRRLLRDAFSDSYNVGRGQDVAAAIAKVGPSAGVERILDAALRTGPYGDGFGSVRNGLTLATLEESPHGIDLGPLAPRIPEILKTPTGRIELAPALLANEALSVISEGAPVRQAGAMLLIGRRQTRSHNSWLHNLPVLAKGPFRCTMMINPDDAARLKLRAGDKAIVQSRVGAIVAVVEISEEMMPGVVSLPHGWGHSFAETRLTVAAEQPGVNSNALSDDKALEPLTGTAILNGIPVEIAAIEGGAG